MRIRSFQVKLAALSLVLSGVLLCLFGAFAWVAFYRMSLSRLDNEIKSWAKQALSKQRVVREWDRFAEDMNGVFARGGGAESGNVILLVRDRQGRTVYQSPSWPSALRAEQFPTPDDLRVPPATPDPDPRRPQPPGVTLHFSDVQFRGYSGREGVWRIGSMANEHVGLALGVPLNALSYEMGRLRVAFLSALPGVLLLSAFAGWYVARRALGPVRRVTSTAKSITAQKMDQRISMRSEDSEFEELIQVFNAMLDRLQDSYQQAVRFSADAAHELKTPLAVLQGEIEQALREAEPGASATQTLSNLIAEISRLKAIVEKLLLLSKADAGRLELALERVNLVELVHESIEDALILGPDLKIERNLPREALVSVDRQLIRQVLQNLTSNAVKYNQPGGTISYTLQDHIDNVIVQIANTGSSISPEDKGRIFDRFYRGNRSRDQKINGVGLGLSIAREIVHAHSGTLRFGTADDHGMVIFSISLPHGFVIPSDRLSSN